MTEERYVVELSGSEIDTLFRALLELRISSKERKQAVKQLDDIPDKAASYLKIDENDIEAERMRRKLHRVRDDSWRGEDQK